MKKKYLPIQLGAPGEEISSKDLHAVIQRFKNLNQFRLQSVQNYLYSGQRVFLNLLPLIFHENQALLPGYIGAEAAFGISNYRPAPQTLAAAKQFSKSYRHHKKAIEEPAIDAIFLMGSVGSIAFSKSSDMDIWLCHSRDLSSDQLQILQEKATAVEEWASLHRLEAHFFLMNAEQFSMGKNVELSSESSGETQHFLLLEEFYRTAIHIAGKIPAWWLVPPEQEERYGEYVGHLLDNRFVSHREVIDFGGFEQVPADEYISATLWHIYKSLQSPYKSLLKIFLVEGYASEYPKPNWSCLELKKAVYSGDIDLEKLDPYLMVYEKVEEYLQLVSSKKRLALARQSFYMKVMGNTLRSTDSRDWALRQQCLKDIGFVWQWPEYLLEDFNRQRIWDIHKAVAEHELIRSQLKLCLRMILRFAGEYVEGDFRENKDLQLIIRKLNSFIELKPGKVNVMTTCKNVGKKEQELSVIEEQDENGVMQWFLYTQSSEVLKPPEANCVCHAPSLLELLCWLNLNGLYHRHIKFWVKAQQFMVDASQVKRITDQLQRFFQQHLKSAQLLDFSRANRLTASFLYFNLGEADEPLYANTQTVISERSDPLSYGEQRQSFVISLQRVSISVWGEVSVNQYHGMPGLFQCLNDVFNQSALQVFSETIELQCFTPLRAKSILLRMNVILKQLMKLSKASNGTRYVLPSEGGYYLFKKQPKALSYCYLETDDLLLQALSAEQTEFAVTFFDDFCLPNSCIPYLYSLNKPLTIQVFCRVIGQDINITVLDERGALFVNQHSHMKPGQAFAHYGAFLEGLQEQSKIPFDVGIRFFEVKTNDLGELQCKRVRVKPQFNHLDLNIRITANAAATSSKQLMIYCNDVCFHHDNSEDLFAAVRQYVAGFRKSNERYAVYINEVDAPCRLLGCDAPEGLHSLHYLNFKRKMERALLES